MPGGGGGGGFWSPGGAEKLGGRGTAEGGVINFTERERVSLCGSSSSVVLLPKERKKERDTHTYCTLKTRGFGEWYIFGTTVVIMLAYPGH